MLPNFFIVGAARSGTSSLFFGLAQHPQICMSKRKEPRFFTPDSPLAIKSRGEYERMFGHCASERAVGEASPQYLYDEAAPGRIRALVPDAKIIIMLRNPADMAYSLWKMMALSHGLETLSFAEALEAEDGRHSAPGFRKRNAAWHTNFYYFRRGKYAEQVKRYLDSFGSDNVRIFIFEEFIADPGDTYRRLFEFLGVDTAFTPKTSFKNEAKAFRSGLMQKVIVRLYPLVGPLYQSLPEALRTRFFLLIRALYFLNWRKDKLPSMDPGQKAELIRKYMKDIRRLEELTGRDLSVWYRDYV